MNKCFIGDCRDVMRDLIRDRVKVQCIVTSPPYFGLRSYGIGAENGEIGLESTPQEYVERLVEVFRLARDLLADDGTLWLNLGDSYCAAPKGSDKGWDKSSLTKPMDGSERSIQIAQRVSLHNRVRNFPGLKPKDLIGIPWMVAFALRADGWWLRSEITWCKPNGMPQSVEDRPSCATEELFLLTKSKRYFYDAKKVRMPPATSSLARWNQYIEGQQGSQRAHAGAKTNGPMKAVGGPRRDKQRGHSRRHNGFNDRWDALPKDEQMANGSNLRNWWIIPTEGYTEAHFAVMPSALARICILAGSRPGDIVLDQFFGSGTTGEVAQQFGRKWIGIELNPAYEKLQKQRTMQAGMELS